MCMVCFDMTNVTLKIDDDLAREARILAAKRGISMSKLIAQELEGLVRAESFYESAKVRAIQSLSTGFDIGYQKPNSRDTLHER